MVSGLETVRHFSVRGCAMISELGRGHGAKCQDIQSDCPTEYLGVKCEVWHQGIQSDCPTGYLGIT